MITYYITGCFDDTIMTMNKSDMKLAFIEFVIWWKTKTHYSNNSLITAVVSIMNKEYSIGKPRCHLGSPLPLNYNKEILIQMSILFSAKTNVFMVVQILFF